MNPAFSVIFLTTLIGAGQGLFLALFTEQSYAVFHLLPRQGGGFYAAGSLIALVLLAAGLAASFFHLGHPERAWRAASQWRTSWLSREVIALPAFMGVVFCYAVAHWLDMNWVIATLPGGAVVDFTVLLGAVGTILAFVLFGCTGMIYACLRFLREWNSPLTVINFILLGGASGFILAAFYASVAAPELSSFFGAWAIILVLLGLAGRGASLIRNRRLRPKSTMQTAIGVKHPKIVQKTQGSMGGSFNTREFFHGKDAAFLKLVRPGFLLAAFIAPLGLLGLSLSSPATLGLAFLFNYVGLIAERWYFFAEANHPQPLPYQTIG